MIAAKFGDPVAGIDIHMVLVPAPPAPAPIPTPLPHPFIGVVFDPIGAAVGAAIGGGPVFVNGMPAGNTGTEVKGLPHIPTPPGVSFAPNDIPGNEGTLVTGSKTVDFAGSSESRTLSMVSTCNFPLNFPTSICGAVPMGAPVLIGGPEAVDFAAAATQAIRTKWASDKLNALVKGTPGSFRSKAICFLTGHPVDVMTGELIAEAVDTELPGTIPLVFERNYRSRQTESQSLGQGWYHFFDAYIELREGSTVLRLPDGRSAEHPRVEDGKRFFHPPDRYTIAREGDVFRLSVPEGLTYVFGPTLPLREEGLGRRRLIEIRDRAGNRVELIWKGAYLASILDTAGRQIACRYHRSGKLERLLLVDGQSEHLLARYAYGQDGQLAEVTDPLGHSMRYAYRRGVLTREVHKGGLTFHFEWDWAHPQGWCIRTWGDASGGDPDAMDLAPGATPPRAIYDRKLTYDKHRRRTMVEDGRGGITYYEGNALDVVEKEIDPTGRVTQYEWNEHAWKTAEENNAQERFTWTYDARGNRLTEIDPAGQTTRFSYDDLDRLRMVVTPKGSFFEISYDRASRPNVVRRPDGTATIYTHDALGRLVRVDDPMGSRTRYAWTPQHTLAEVIDPEERRTTFEHDLFGRLVAAKDPLGRSLRVIRDAAGQPTLVARPDGEELRLKYDPEGNVIEQLDARGRKTRLRYAGLGQLVEHFDPMGHRVRLRYNEETDLVAVENQAGDLYTFTLDLAGRVTREKTFSGTKRQFVHDKAGRMMQVLSGAYRQTRIERDPLGRITKQVSQGGNPTVLAKPFEERFAYDAQGDLISAETPGAGIVLERDLLGRVLQERETIATTALSATVTSRYDAAGLRVERTTSLAHKTAYAFNRAGELTGVSADWQLGPLVSPLRNLPQARLGPFEIKIARDPLGQELARRLPGGVVSRWMRDPFGRAREHHVLTGASRDSAGTDVAIRTYAWASPEEIASIATLDPTTRAVRGTSQYEHDPRGHLIRQIFSTGEVLERQSDPVGNLFKTAKRNDRRYAPGGVIQQANGTQYQTDADGFLIKKTLSDGATWKYVWDAHGQLTEVTRPDGKSVLFAYDAFGRRVSKTFDGTTTEYIWDRNDLVHERDRSEDGRVAPLTTWVFEPGTFTPLAKIEGRKRYGVVSDHLGSPTMLATEAGRIAWRAQLDVYGVPREEEGVAAAEERTANPWRFPGQYEDAETGLYYNRFRYYDPELGRYLSEDPIGLSGGTAQYAYVETPIAWIDVLGLAREPVRLGEGGRFGDFDDRRVTSDGLTPHHMPQDKLGFLSRRDGGAVVMDEADHTLTRTFGNKGKQTLKEDAGAAFRTVLAKDIRDLRTKFGSKYDSGIRDMLAYYKREHPDRIKKVGCR